MLRIQEQGRAFILLKILRTTPLWDIKRTELFQLIKIHGHAYVFFIFFYFYFYFFFYFSNENKRVFLCRLLGAKFQNMIPIKSEALVYGRIINTDLFEDKVHARGFNVFHLLYLKIIVNIPDDKLQRETLNWKHLNLLHLFVCINNEENFQGKELIRKKKRKKIFSFPIWEK